LIFFEQKYSFLVYNDSITIIKFTKTSNLNIGTTILKIDSYTIVQGGRISCGWLGKIKDHPRTFNHLKMT